MTKRGRDLLNDAIRNRGTAFPLNARARLGLRGLLPPGVETLEQQVARVVENCNRKSSDLERYIFLMALQDQNETLFYRTLVEHLDAYMPLIYTPTVGEAAQQYAHIFRRPRGLYVTAEDRGHVEEALRNWPEQDVRVVVVTDGSRVLGLGDLGANGMTIPIGKLALYTAAGGVPPAATLPVMLDVGTDNTYLRDDPLYLGLRQPRLAGDGYYELLDEFVDAVQAVYPRAMIQLEDFATPQAQRLLSRYRSRLCLFSDHTQGRTTAAVAGLLASFKVIRAALREHTFLFAGTGSVNVGVANMLVQALCSDGFDVEDARRRCWFVDKDGLVVADRDDVAEGVRPFAHQDPRLATIDEVVQQVCPTVLVGTTGSRGAFSRSALEIMARKHERPVIFALSTPATHAEVTAEDAYRWTEGRAVFAGGAQFSPVEIGEDRHVPGWVHSIHSFPGIGLAVIATQVSKLTDEMLLAAARAIAESLNPSQLAKGQIFPDLQDIREVSLKVACAVAEVAFDRGLARVPQPSDLRTHLESCMYWPEYA